MILDTLFAAVFAAYIAHSVVTNPQRGDAADKVTPAGLALQSPLFLLACVYGWRHGVFTRDWVSPLAIGAGLIVGHLVFGASVLATHRNLRDTFHHLTGLHDIGRFLADNPEHLFRYFIVGVSEEMIYRAAAQPILTGWIGQPVVAILLVAAAFSVAHWHFFRNPIAQSAEFAAFSVLLGALYYSTGSLMFVIVIHTLRNLEIVYLEQCIEAEEGGEDASLPGLAKPEPPETAKPTA